MHQLMEENRLIAVRGLRLQGFVFVCALTRHVCEAQVANFQLSRAQHHESMVQREALHRHHLLHDAELWR